MYAICRGKDEIRQNVAFWLFRISRGTYHILGVSCAPEYAVAGEIKVKPLKETSGTEDPITAALEHLDLVVQSLHEATALAVQEVVRDLVETLVQVVGNDSPEKGPFRVRG